MERGLVLRQHFFGAESDEVWNACKTVGEMCNLLAMTYLQQEDFNMVLELLKKAEILTERDPPGRAATFNNLACYYRRQGKLHAALQYLQKALKIESKLMTVQNPADTHINACAVLSQLGRHQAALEHAQNALILLQEELLSPPGGATSAKAPQADRIAVLAIAYHNIGVEQEFLKRYEQSMLSYRKGVEVAERYLGPKHAICITLRNSLLAAKKAAAKEDVKGGKRIGRHAAQSKRGESMSPTREQKLDESGDRIASKMMSSENNQGLDPGAK
jgi:tetratricopeptide (TPR) repeat protein